MRFRLKHRTKRFIENREKQKRLMEFKQDKRSCMDSWQVTAERAIENLKKEEKWHTNETIV